MDDEEVNGGGGPPADGDGPARPAYERMQRRMDLQFAEGDRLDRRLGASLGFSGGILTLFGAAILISLSSGGWGAEVGRMLTGGIITAAALFALNVLTAAATYGFFSDLIPGADIDDLAVAARGELSERELYLRMMDADHEAIRRNQALLRRKARLVLASLLLSTATTAVSAAAASLAGLS